MNRIGVYGAVLAGLLLNGWAAWGATTRYVDCNATGLDNGSSWTDAFKELTNAINIASADGDEIWIAQGTYYPAGPTDNDRTKWFNINTVAHAGRFGIYGGFTNGMASKDERNWTNYPVVLSGDIQRDGIMTNNSYHVLYLNDDLTPTTCTVDGVTITLGCADGADNESCGGAVYKGWNKTLILTNCMICTNFGTVGAVYSRNYLIMENCTVMANSNRGVNASRNSTIRNCTFKQNVHSVPLACGAGAGLCAAIGPTLIDNCRFFDNKSDADFGGGLHVYTIQASGSLVTNCVFSGNQAGNAGGLLYNGSAYVMIMIADCIFSGNRALSGGGGYGDGSGGGAWTRSGGLATFRNCTFCGNEAAKRGSAVYTHDFTPASTLENCLLVGNKGWDCVRNRAGHTTTVNNCTFSGNSNLTATICNAGGGSLLAFTMTNSILWTNKTGGGYAEIYNDAGSTSYVYYTAFTATNDLTGTVLGAGCMAADPLFAGMVATGVWTAAGNYDPESGRTTLSNASASWTPGAFAGLTVQSDINSHLQFYIVTNAANTMLIWCGTNAIPTNGAAYRVYNYHEKSKLGRWTPLGWVRDTVQSPCIDAGDPASAFALEPHPNGARINMGAYGNTDEASQTAINSGTIIRFK